MAKDKKSKKIISTKSAQSTGQGNIVDASSGKKKTIVSKSKSAIGNVKTNETSNWRANKAVISQDVLFGRQNYLFVGIAFGLIMLGMLLMMGGDMPDSNTWDESLIYSTRRTLIAPIVILIGLVVGVISIFRD